MYKSNLTAGAVQVEANLQVEHSDHLHFIKLNNAKTPGIKSNFTCLW